MFIDYRSPRERAGQFQPKTKKMSGRTILEGLGMVAGIVAILLWTTLEMAPVDTGYEAREETRPDSSSLVLPEENPFLAGDEGLPKEAEMERDPLFSAAEEAASTADEVVTGIINPEETFTTLLTKYLSTAEVIKIADKCRPVFPLGRMQGGQPYKFHIDKGLFSRFVYEIDDKDQLIITRGKKDFVVKREKIPCEVRIQAVRVNIRSSLSGAVASAGESRELASRVAGIFAWDVDFLRDIRAGDSFSVVVEKRFRKDKFVGYGKILAAEIVNQGTTYKAYRYETSKGVFGYFDENGKSLQKGFLRAPLAYMRISSRFTYRRFHPVLRRYRPHTGVDYAAPRGTPIHSVASGVVLQRGYNRFSGKFVRIRHNNGMETLYNHMSSFAPGLGVGSHVPQGRMIGRVGSTGIATGPHLDFRMYRNGVPIDPLSVKTIYADPVPSRKIADFRAVVKSYAPQLKAGVPNNIGIAEKHGKSSMKGG